MKLLRLALIEQEWRLSLDHLPRSGRTVAPSSGTRLPVTVFGRDGGVGVDPATYRLDAAGRPARLHFLTSPAHTGNGIEIDFTAGFGEAGTDVPILSSRRCWR